ncbi:MAG: S-layer family protein [Brasilonema octagenarum HA4186-MV1]|jgi:filamentous hemagglutinin family protein|nr:S-layer family protein [Brasilonema octagenarum HA4186-MV1]
MSAWHLKSWVLLGSALCVLGCAQPIAAQVVPDNTLSAAERTQVTGNPNFQIDGGARRGGNLFHSFQSFSVPTGGSAFFNNAADVQNILTRVTGGSISNIDGLIRTNGIANLFLLNPSGIIFGKNASLNIGGSFVATTANAIQFGNFGFFSATNPEAPSPLLTINPNALFFNQIAAARIQNNSTAPAGSTLAGDDAFGLRVPNGRSLLLVGGDIKMDGGKLNAFGGRVELGGLSAPGTVGLNGDGSLSFPVGVQRADVSLTNGAEVNVRSGGGGTIAVNTRNLEMTGRSFLRAGIGEGLGTVGTQAGDISINATGAINLNNSLINNDVQSGANGQGGDVSISASSLRLEGGAAVSASILGAGKGGNLRVDAQDVQLIGRSADGQTSSGLLASANQNSTGDAGDLTIKTNTLLVRDGAVVSAGTFGAGKGGNLRVDAQDVQLIGTSADGQYSSGLSATAEPNSTGDAGDLTIKTNTLLVRDGAQVGTGTVGAGKAGNLRVDAQDVQLIGRSADGRVGSGLFASADLNSTGNAGDLTIKTNTLLVRDGAVVFTGTFGAGKAGNLSVDAQDVQLIGKSADGQYPSALGASAQRNSTGNAGDLTIKTNTLLVRDGAQVFTSTSGAGEGGNLSVDAQDVQLIGTSADGQAPSGLFASADLNLTGNAGDLTIKTNTLLVRDGAQVFTGTFGAGKGGNLSVDAQDVQLIGTSADGQYSSGLFASGQPNSTGDAGDLTIKTNTLLVRDSATVSVRSRGTGRAGNMTLNARSIRLNNNASLTANTRSPKADPTSEQATININSKDLIITRNSNIITNATGENVFGGNININTSVLAGFQNSDISANSANFRGGNVRINTKGIFGLQFRDIGSLQTNDITATGATRELSGNVLITRPDVDPTSGLVELPVNVVDRSGLIAQGCPADQGNSFVVTGRGGLPPTPEQELDDDAEWQDRRRLTVQQQTGHTKPHTEITTQTLPTKSDTPIIEATGWQITPNGDIFLVASTSNPAVHNPRNQPDTCQSRQ